MTKKISREVQKEQRREEIINAAEELFIAKGLSETSMPDIAKKVNMSVRTVYRYYKTKEELAFEIEIRILEKIIDKQGHSTKKIKGKNGYEKLKYMLCMKGDFCSEEELRFMGMFDYYFTGAYPYNELSTKFVSMLQNMNNPIYDFILEGMKDGSIRKDIDARLTTRTIGNAMLALSQRILFRGEHLNEEQGGRSEKMAPCLIELILNGLSNNE